MGSVASIGRRLAALEGKRGRDGLAHLSNEALLERIAAVDAELVAGLEAEGVVIPPGLGERGTHDRNAWIAARVREMEG